MDEIFQFVATFYNVIPDEALSYLKTRIDILPEAHLDMQKYDFEKNSNYHTIRSKIIDILIGFKYTDHFIDAIQLALYYFEKNNSEPMDRVSMSFLFGVVCNLPEEQRLSAVMIFCKCNPDFDAFRNIHIMPTHASWSGSEVPIIEQYIAFLIKFRENLKGIQFIEHRAYISEEIQDLQKRKEEVLLREFLEER